MRLVPLVLSLCAVACAGSSDKDAFGFDSDPFGDPDGTETDVDDNNDNDNDDDDEDPTDGDSAQPTDVSPTDASTDPASSDSLSAEDTAAAADDSAAPSDSGAKSDVPGSDVASSDGLLTDARDSASPADSGAPPDSGSSSGTDVQPSDPVGPDTGTMESGATITDGATDLTPVDSAPTSDRSGDSGSPVDSAAATDPSDSGLRDSELGETGVDPEESGQADTGGWDPGWGGTDTGGALSDPPVDSATDAATDWGWGDTGPLPVDTAPFPTETGGATDPLTDPLTDWGWNDTGTTPDTGGQVDSPTDTDLWDWGTDVSDSPSDDPWDTGGIDVEAGDLVITEVMVNPDECTDPDGEYVEIANISGRTLDLSGVRVIDDASVAVLPAGTQIVAGDRLWLARSPTVKRCYGSPDVEFTAQFQLANVTDNVRIERPNGGLIDEVVWTNLSFGAASWRLDDRALTWVRPQSANDDPGNWCPSVSPIPGHTDKGSPGAANGQCPGVVGPPDSGLSDVPMDTGPFVPGSGLMIVEVVDHAVTASVKYVEVYNPTAGPVSLSGWAVGIAANGSSTVTSSYTFPAASLASGGTVVVAWSSGAVDFTTTFGRAATFTSTAMSGNGDDTYVLLNNDVVVDIYGQLGVDGDGQAWNYLDSVARRKTAVTSPRATWTASEWTITAGAGAANPFARD